MPGIFHSLFRFYFAYTQPMRIGGHTRQIDLSKLGPSLLIASSLVLAIRTAKWAPSLDNTSSDRDWEVEVARSIKIADRVLGHLLSKKPGLFVQKNEPWYEPTDEDSPR